MAGRGWAWTAYDWDEGRLFNYIGDAQNSYPIWNATPLVALDVYEHAYFLDYRTDRAAYIDAFFENLDWATVNDWVSKYGIPSEVSRHRDARLHRRRLPRRQPPLRVLGRPLAEGRRHPDASAAGTSARRTSGGRSGRATAIPVIAARRREGLRTGARRDARCGARRRGARRRRGDARALAADLPRLREGREDGRDLRRRAPRPRPARRAHRSARLDRVFALTRYASVASILAALSLPVAALLLEEPWPVLVFAAAAALGVLLLHRGNLSRLRAGTETRVQLRRKPAATT